MPRCERLPSIQIISPSTPSLYSSLAHTAALVRFEAVLVLRSTVTAHSPTASLSSAVHSFAVGGAGRPAISTTTSPARSPAASVGEPAAADTISILPDPVVVSSVMPSFQSGEGFTIVVATRSTIQPVGTAVGTATGTAVGTATGTPVAIVEDCRSA